ncbi:cation transporter [Candidatus Tenderia electrophaga]|jgi:cation diffusion facilitator family transporter|uniref:Cation transporter n=1 Tax=Candidatus Tenderia electrophaga TaxID=1748243 RepID=A0A0S2TF58_9GAMM|nr:cation transporter [Candidatus Tenderia electrophaga]
MANCCEDKACELDALGKRQRHVLQIVLVINALMFFVESGAGLIARSTALLADSLDMLGDALVYGFSLWVITRDQRWRAIAALLKGLIMAAFGIVVLLEVLDKLFEPVLPIAPVIGTVGFIALAANSVCLVLLLRHRHDDINMRSTWLCSRNDIIANVSVLAAAGGVAVSGSMWPDVIVGLGIALLFLHSAIHVLKQSVIELQVRHD